MLPYDSLNRKHEMNKSTLKPNMLLYYAKSTD